MWAVKDLLDNLLNQKLFNDEEKSLLVEAALRHDDGHIGNTYRQEKATDNLSNEEYAVVLLREDLQGLLSKEQLKYMEDNILATSFGQGDITKLSKGKENYYRPYKPETDSEKLLAFADVSGFVNGWQDWVDESLRLLQESPQNTPADIDAWIKNREGFVNFYISPLLQSIKHLLKQEYFEQLEKDLDVIRQELSKLKDKSTQERENYEIKLREIRNSVD